MPLPAQPSPRFDKTGELVVSFPPKIVPIVPPIVLVQEYVQKRGLTQQTLEAAGVRICATIDELFGVLGGNAAVWPARKAGYTCALYFPANGQLKSQNYRARLLRAGNPELLAPVSDAKAFKGKYLGMKGASNVLYQCPPEVLPHQKAPHDVFIVEGALQAIRLGQDGIHAV